MRNTLLLTLIVVAAAMAPATAQTFSREQDIGAMRLGQKVLVDDGTCPAGQVKEISGARLVANGVEVVRQCIPQKVRR